MHIDEGSGEGRTARSEKEADVKRERDDLQGSSREGIFATVALKSATGQAQLAPWRTEPEIGPARQEQLTRCLATIPDITRGIYPFKGMKLSRADVEWLLAEREKGRGPGARNDEQQQNHQGLDLRGADLRYEDLHALPLTRLRGSLTRAEWDEATEEQHAAAAVLLTGTDLREANLEEAYLNEAHLENTYLYKAHLERTFLYKAHLEGARLSRTHIEEARLKKALESGEQHIGPSIADAQWGNVNLAVVSWSQVDMLGDEYAARQATRRGKRKSSVIRLDEYELAVRANRQLAVALRAQGLDEEAARFAYRAQLLQSIVLRRQGKFVAYLFSLLLDLLAGYGYRPGRSLMGHRLVIFLFIGL